MTVDRRCVMLYVGYVEILYLGIWRACNNRLSLTEESVMRVVSAKTFSALCISPDRSAWASCDQMET